MIATIISFQLALITAQLAILIRVIRRQCGHREG